MKVVFVGASKFSVRILTKLVSLEEVEIAELLPQKKLLIYLTAKTV